MLVSSALFQCFFLSAAIVWSTYSKLLQVQWNDSCWSCSEGEGDEEAPALETVSHFTAEQRDGRQPAVATASAQPIHSDWQFGSAQFGYLSEKWSFSTLCFASVYKSRKWTLLKILPPTSSAKPIIKHHVTILYPFGIPLTYLIFVISF